MSSAIVDNVILIILDVLLYEIGSNITELLSSVPSPLSSRVFLAWNKSVKNKKHRVNVLVFNDRNLYSQYVLSIPHHKEHYLTPPRSVTDLIHTSNLQFIDIDIFFIFYKNIRF